MSHEHSPLVLVAFFFLSGIFLGWICSISTLVIFLCICLYSLVFFFSGKAWCFYLAILLMGMWRTTLVQQNPIPMIQEEKILIKVQGVISSTPLPLHWIPGDKEYERLSKNFFLVKTARILQNEGWLETQKTVKVIFQGNPYDLRRGYLVEIFGWLSSIPKPSNPGESDMQGFWKANGVDYQMIVAEKNIQVLETGQGCPVLNFFSYLRIRYIEILRDTLGIREGNMVSALLLGARRLLEENTMENFRKTGVFHLLAISGAHVSIVAWLIHQALLRLLLPFSLCRVAVLLVCLAYSFLADLQTPVVRSTIMISVHLLAPLIGRKPCVLNSLALSAILILWLNPLELMQPGFSLSFCACLAIFKLYLPLAFPLNQAHSKKQNFWSSVLHYLREANLVSWIAWLGTSPLLAYHFHQITPWGAIFTVFLMPLVTLILALSLLLLFSCLGTGWPLLLLSFALSKTVVFMENMVEIFALFPYVCFSLVPPMLFFILLFYIFLIFFCFDDFKKYIYFSIIFSMVFGSVFLRPVFQKNYEMTVLNVGNGGAIYIYLPEGKHILYDCGSMNSQAGKRIIVPFLLERGIFQLDCVILSHYDSDHYNAFPDVLSFFRVKKLYINQAFARNGQKILELAQKFSVQIHEAKDNHRDKEFPGITFLYPGEHLPQETWRQDNEHSLMLLLEIRNQKALLTADIGSKGLQIFLQKSHTPVDILQLPHHGSYIPELAPLLHKLQPKTLFICSHGRLNQSKTLKLCEKSQIPLFQTHKDGAILFSFCSKNILLFRQGL